MLLTHCNDEFMKHVLPKLFNPVAPRCVGTKNLNFKFTTSWIRRIMCQQIWLWTGKKYLNMGLTPGSSKLTLRGFWLILVFVSMGKLSEKFKICQTNGIFTSLCPADGL